MVMALNIDVVRCRKFYGEFLCVRIRDSVHVAQRERSSDRCPSRLRHRAVAPPGLHRTETRVAIQLKTFLHHRSIGFFNRFLLSQFFQSYFLYPCTTLPHSCSASILYKLCHCSWIAVNIR